jgi:predicted metal-dependent enzyme (double-stranded beta helix superfamily)
MSHHFEFLSPAAAAPLNVQSKRHRRATLTPKAELEASAALTRFSDALEAAFAVVPDGADPSDSRCAAQFARLMRAALNLAVAEDLLLTPAQREGAANAYRRHLLIADPQGRYAAAALVWQSGQASPVHGHHTWCGYAVLDGTLSETLYTCDERSGCAIPSRTQLREAGALSYVRAGLTAVHRLANTGTRPAVSLHVYGVSAERIATHVNRLVSPDFEPALSNG